ncbi:MAG: hypothetical protein ABJC74_09570 [Gemmatimonadota bacterium]
MRTIEGWVEGPLRGFVDDAAPRLTLIMTGSGQVVAQHGFARSLDVMSAAALGAGIMASSQELTVLMGWPQFRILVHQGMRQSHLLAQIPMPRANWIGLVVFGTETKLGVVQFFFERMVEQLAAAAPVAEPPRQVLAIDFERELNASLRTLFGR